MLKDTNGILEKPGEHSEASRLVKFTNHADILALESTLKAYIFEAIEVEKSGLKFSFKKNPEPIPLELEQKFEEDPTLKNAFYTLTPGRQRGYILYF